MMGNEECDSNRSLEIGPPTADTLCYVSVGSEIVSVVDKYFGGRVEPSGKFPELATLLGRIKDAYSPLYVVLYGSRARGKATSQSDWDLKVIVAVDAPELLFPPLFGWDIQEGSGVYADVSCIRLSDFREDLSVPTSATSYMVDDGIVLDVSLG